MSMEMGMGTPENGMEKPESELRKLVGDLLKDSTYFFGKKMVDSKEIDLIDAIEADQVNNYFNADPPLLRAPMSDKAEEWIALALTEVSTELKKQNPDQNLIDQDLQNIKNLL